MILGRVVGELWATRRDQGLDGCKLLLVKPHCWYNPTFDVAHLVAVDHLGAGVGEDVVVCLGEPARRSFPEQNEAGGGGPGYEGAAWLPVDAAVMAIVDSLDWSGR
jgi:ethanolamine utilization protein EutN